MKNKKNIWILTPLVLIIWGIIGYRIMKTVNGNQKPLSAVTTYPELQTTAGTDDTSYYKLKLDYDDPFLKGRRAIAVASTASKPDKTKKAKTVIKRKKTEEKPVMWPAILYHGLIEKKNERSPLCLIEMNGNSVMMKKGQVLNQVKLLEVYGDSVKLEYLGKGKRNFKKG